MLGKNFVIAAAGLIAGTVQAHDAPAGWRYDLKCCSGIDCREVNHDPGVRVKETPEGYLISTTGETISYRDTRIRQSPDGEYHWCSSGGLDTSRTICLYVPPRGY
ncbi:hypothetical protein ACC806_34505 [Rhizobium ruizarguesonis]